MNDLNRKESLASDLYEFARLLDKYGLISDGKDLYDASEKIRTSQNKEFWKYDCTKLKFQIDGKVSGTIPTNISYVEIIFSIEIEGVYNLKNIYHNPLNALTFDLELFGLNSDSAYFYAAWHLDKHISKTEDNKCSFHHPEYHFTFGGYKMEEQGDVFGNCLILPSPRISYPPMDAILGIDFILQNYLALPKRRKIMDDSRYKEIIFNSQVRLWKPYYTSITSKWHEFSDISFDQNIHYTKMNPFLNL